MGISFGGGKFTVFKDIAERDQWIKNNPPPLGGIKVRNAKDDPEVTLGSAFYHYDEGEFVRFGEKQRPITDVQKVAKTVNNNSVILDNKPLNSLILSPKVHLGYVYGTNTELFDLIYDTRVIEFVDGNDITKWRVEFYPFDRTDLEGKVVSFIYLKQNFVYGGECIYKDLDTGVTPLSKKAVTGEGVHNAIEAVRKLLPEINSLDNGKILMIKDNKFSLSDLPIERKYKYKEDVPPPTNADELHNVRIYIAETLTHYQAVKDLDGNLFWKEV